jgi:hypothetical protein
MRQGTRLKLNGRGSGFRASEILGILEGTCRVVLFQVSAVDGLPEALVSYMYGTNGDFVTCHLDSATRVLQKRSVPAVWLHAPGSDEGTVFHHDNPNANEAVLAGAGPDAQTFALPENSQDVIGKLSFCFHARIRPAARRSDRSMPLMTLLFKRSGRDDKTPSERFHCSEVILESEGGSGRVVGKREVMRFLPACPSLGAVRLLLPNRNRDPHVCERNLKFC